MRLTRLVRPKTALDSRLPRLALHWWFRVGSIRSSSRLAHPSDFGQASQVTWPYHGPLLPFLGLKPHVHFHPNFDKNANDRLACWTMLEAKTASARKKKPYESRPPCPKNQRSISPSCKSIPPNLMSNQNRIGFFATRLTAMHTARIHSTRLDHRRGVPDCLAVRPTAPDFWWNRFHQ